MSSPPGDAEAAISLENGYHFNILDFTISFRDRSSYLLTVASTTVLVAIVTVVYTALIVWLTLRCAGNNSAQPGVALKQGQDKTPLDWTFCEINPNDEDCLNGTAVERLFNDTTTPVTIDNTSDQLEEEHLYTEPSPGPDEDATVGPSAPYPEDHEAGPNERGLKPPTLLRPIPTPPMRGISVNRICSCADGARRLKCSCWNPSLSTGTNTTFRLFVIASNSGAVKTAQLRPEV